MRMIGAGINRYGSSKPQTPNAAPNRQSLLNVLLRWMGNCLDSGSKGSELQGRQLEEGPAVRLGIHDACTQTPNLFVPGDTFSEPFSVHVSPGDGIYSTSASDADKQIDTLVRESSELDICGQHHVVKSGCENEPPMIEDLRDSVQDNASETLMFPEDNRMINIDSFVAMFLTEESIQRLGHIITANKTLKQLRSNFKIIDREASIGQSYMDNAESQINDHRLPEQDRSYTKVNLQRRKPEILTCIEQRASLGRELGIRQCKMDFLRDQADDIFEQVLVDAGLLADSKSLSTQTSQEQEEISAESSCEVFSMPGSPKDNVDVEAQTFERLKSDFVCQEQQLHCPTKTDYFIRGARTTKAGTGNSRDRDAFDVAKVKEEHTQAFEAMLVAAELFDRREEAYQEDLARHANRGEYSRSEVDFLHAARGAKLATTLRQAEEEFERTRAQAKALNLLAESNGSEAASWYDEADDGYRESEDPAQNANLVDRNHIETWMTDVDGSQHLPGPSAPTIDWEIESVGISDSWSVCAHSSRNKRNINKWHAHQELLRVELNAPGEE